MSSRSINSKVHQAGLLKAGQNDQAGVKQQDLPLGEVAAIRAKRREAVTEERNRIVAKWLDAALSQHPKAGAIAADCGISDAYLSQMRTGERTIPFHLVLGLLEHEPSALALLSEMCEHAKLAPPSRPRKVTKHEVERATTRRVRGILQLWQIVRADVAAELETTTDDAEAALDEVTGEVRFAK